MAAGSAELERVWDEARAAWPGVTVAREPFVRFLEARATRAGGLSGLRTADLYLACACLAGDAAALRAFEALLDEVGRKLRRLAGDDDVLDEAKQIVRRQLVPRDDKPAPLADYAGRGELGGWLRIALGRELVRVRRAAAREPQAGTGELAALPDGEDDPETAYLKTHYRQEFRDAFAAAMEGLDADERRALRYAVVDRLGIDDIARLEGVHRATAARQVARARERLAETTRRTLRERLKIDPAELESVLRLIESQVEVSVHRLLGR